MMKKETSTFHLYEQFQKQGGFFELPLVLYRVSGMKAGELLHGQLTNHIKGLKEEEGNYNLLLTIKGKIIADLYVWRSQESYFLLLQSQNEGKVIDHLKKFAPLSRVELKNESNLYSFLHLCIPEEVSYSPFQPDHAKYHLRTIDIESCPLSGFRSDRLGVRGYDLLIPFDNKEKIISLLKNQGFILMDFNLQNTIRVEKGISQVGVDATEANFPQEARLDQTLHFDKGCYLGQEIIARLHFRGHVTKVLVGLKLDSSNVPPPQTPLFEGEKQVGFLTSVVFSQKLNAVLALGYVPYDSKEGGHSFKVGDTQIRAQVVELPKTIYS